MDQLHLKCTHFRREEGHGQEHQFLTQKGPSVDTGCVAYSVMALDAVSSLFSAVGAAAWVPRWGVLQLI